MVLYDLYLRVLLQRDPEGELFLIWISVVGFGNCVLRHYELLFLRLWSAVIPYF